MFMATDRSIKIFGRELAKARNAVLKTGDELAQDAGMRGGSIRRLEGEETPSLLKRNARRLAAALRMTEAEFMERIAAPVASSPASEPSALPKDAPTGEDAAGSRAGATAPTPTIDLDEAADIARQMSANKRRLSAERFREEFKKLAAKRRGPGGHQK